MKSWSRDLRIITLLIGLCLAPQVSTAQAPPFVFHALNRADLINAINAANSGSSPAVIFLHPSTYRLVAQFSSEFGPSALPAIKSNVTIVGHDAATTILDGTAVFARVLTVLPGGRLTIKKTTITGGKGFGFEFDSNRNGGGAAASFKGFLRFQDCVLSGNQAEDEFGGWGGAILSVDGGVEITRTTISDNVVDEAFAGGGLALVRSTSVIRDSIISGNQAIGAGVIFGGGMFVSGGTLAIYGSTIAGNGAFGNQGGGDLGQGGGIYNSGGTILLANSAVVGNFGGGSNDEGRGGGINNSPSAVLTIRNVTIGGNTAGTFGGGIYNLGTLRLKGVTIAGNDASAGYEGAPPTSGGGVWNGLSGTLSGTVTTARSVIAGNTVGNTEAPGTGPDCAGTLQSLGHNAVGNGANCKVKGTNTNDLFNVDPRLAALADNGVAGNAHYPLRLRSPLIDAGDGLGPQCTFTDQLGQRRVDGNKEGNVECDIGAIEFVP